MYESEKTKQYLADLVKRYGKVQVVEKLIKNAGYTRSVALHKVNLALGE